MIKNSAAEMAQSLASGATTSVALTQAHLDRIADVDSEVHAFLQNSAYIENGSFYNIPFEIQTVTRTITDTDGSDETVTEKNVILDIHTDISKKLKLFPDKYKLVYNFFINYIGGPSELEANQRMFIADISPNRRELKLKLINENYTK